MIDNQPSQEDMETGADLLYDLVETLYLEGKVIPTKVELRREARQFNFGIKDSLDCVKVMEQKYRDDLHETGYFGGVGHANDLENKI